MNQDVFAEVGAVDPRDITRPLYGASFGAAIARLFKGFFRFKGRASKSEFWWGILFLNIVSWVASFVPMMLAFVPMFAVFADPTINPETEAGSNALAAALFGGFAFATPLVLIIAVVTYIPMISLTWRRFQDANKHGAFSLLVLGFGWIVLIVAGVLETDPAGAQYDRP